MSDDLDELERDAIWRAAYAERFPFGGTQRRADQAMADYVDALLRDAMGADVIPLPVSSGPEVAVPAPGRGLGATNGAKRYPGRGPAENAAQEAS